MRKLQIIGALLLVPALALSACAPKAAPAPVPSPSPAPSAAPAPQLGDWDKIVAAASKEGTVTVYRTLVPALEAALRDGMKQYGIKVEAVGGTSADIAAKLLAEQRAKSYSADIVIDGWNVPVDIVQAGYGQPVTAALPTLANKDIWKINPGKYDANKNIFVISTNIAPSIIVNTDLVKKGEISAWQDLLDPKWRGKMVMSDPRTGSGPGTSIQTWQILGEDFWKKMATQGITMQVKYDQVVSQIALGDKAVGIFPPFTSIIPAIRAGAPIQMVHFKEGVVYAVNGAAIVKNAPHPNAALVVLNWMLTKEGQTAIGIGLGTYTIRKDIVENWLGVPELNPATFTLLEPANNVDAAATAKATDFAKAVFGKQ